jgi:DNA-binding FadR family transcriptional regulator
MIMARTSLSQQTADKLLNMIKKQYKPGNKIPTEAELTQFFGISRTTVREAVKILCSKNILEIRRGSGTFVKENPGMPEDPLRLEFNDEDEKKREMFEINKMLQPVLMKSAAEKASDEDIERVRNIHNEFVETLARYRDGEYVKPSTFRKLDVKFHFAIINSCHNQFIERLLEYFIASCSDLHDVWLSLELRKSLEIFEKYHTLIMDDFSARDGEKIYADTLEHTIEVEKLYQSCIADVRKN